MKTFAALVGCAAVTASALGQLTYVSGVQTNAGYVRNIRFDQDVSDSYSEAAPNAVQSWSPAPRELYVHVDPGTGGTHARLRTTWASVLEPAHLSWNSTTPAGEVVPDSYAAESTVSCDKTFDVVFHVDSPTTVNATAALVRHSSGWFVGAPFSITLGPRGGTPLYSSAIPANPNDFNGGFSTGAIVLLPGDYEVVGQNHTYWSGGRHGGAGITDSMSFDMVVTAVSASIYGQPADVSVPAGQAASFTVQAYGSNPQYQWRHNGTPLSDGGEFSGTHTATLTINPALAADAGTYDVDVTTSAGHDVSRAATLTITSIFLQQPNGASIAAGYPVSLSVQVAASNAQFEWRRNGMPLSDNGRITGSHTATLAISPALTTDAGSYDVRVTTPYVQETSFAANLAVGCPQLGVAAQPRPLRLNACQTAELSITVSPVGEPATYQWRRNGLALSDTARISGSRTNHLTIHPIGPSLGGNYDVLFSNACSSGQSTVAVAEVGAPADFDGDTDVGTDFDIEAFFRCLAGNCCGTCYSVDFDGDGDIGTDRDIESFFRALAGGGCS